MYCQMFGKAFQIIGKFFFPYSNHSVIECLDIHFEMSLAFTPTEPFLQPYEDN